jgi:ATP adenylyltransferase
MATNCPFCDPSGLGYRIVHTGTFVRIVVPLEPATDRHFLLIPMVHRPEFCDLNADELAELQDLVHLLRDCLRTPQSVGHNLLSNNGGSSADQHVGHFHQHVFLREAGAVSPFAVLNGTADQYHFTSDELLEHCASIRQKLRCE